MSDQPSQTTTTDEYHFSKPELVLKVVDPMQRIEDIRALDRSRINVQANGNPPYSPEEQKKYSIEINVDWGLGRRIYQDANRQLNNALLHTGTLFNCTAKRGKLDKRDEWSLNFTKNIHEPIQDGISGKRHNALIQNRNCTLSLHGIGAMLWPTDFKWMPRFVPLEDLLIPTDTYCDFSNLPYFAVNLYLSVGEFVDMTQGEKVDKGWNKEMVADILDGLKEVKTESAPSTWRNQPEQMMEIFKQNQGYYYSDVPEKVRLRAFYFQNPKNKKWYRHIILREAINGVDINQFVYDGGDKVFADHIDHILNIQYGDSNLIAPKKYHSTRGLGIMLYAAIDTLNRLQCEFVQSVFEHLKMYFKINDPADRDRLKQVVLQQYGFIPEGLNIVKREERHEIDAGLVDNAMAQMRQVMQDSSANYVQNLDNGTSKERTAREVNVLVNQANVLVGGMLQAMYLQEAFYYQELVRRFCQKHSDDPEVIEFQRKCKEDGIPDELMTADAWKVTPERVIGNGDRTLAQNIAQWLWENRMSFDPQARRVIERTVVSTITDDTAKGLLYVPAAAPQSTDGTVAAENLFGTLMSGNQCPPREGIDQQGYVTRMLQMMGNVIKRISATTNVGTGDEIVGLMTSCQNVSQSLSILASDESNKQMVKQFADVLGQMMNEVKGFAQRFQQQQGEQQGHKVSESMSYKDAPEDVKRQIEAQAGLVPSQLPVPDPKTAKAVQGMQNAQAKFQQKQRHDQVGFHLEEMRKNLATISDLKREGLQHHQQLMADSMTHAIDSFHQAKMASQQSNEKEVDGSNGE